jgi:hypothetical protein
VIPLVVDARPRPDREAALVLVGEGAAPEGFALVRHAGAAAAAQAGTCPCCRRPSDVVTALRRLAIDRASGRVEFARVVVAAPESVLAELAADPFIAARYRLPSAPFGHAIG